MSGTKTGKFYSSPDDRYLAILSKVGESKSIEFDKPFTQLDENAKHIAMYGCGDEQFDVKWNYKRGNVEGVHEMSTKWIGFVGWINDEYQRKHADKRGEAMLGIMKNKECDSCHSHRIKSENLEYKIHNKNIGELSALSSIEALKLFKENKFSIAAEKIMFDVIKILQSLIKSGIGYLAANRITSTLSGGEFQRLQLAGLLKSPLTGVLYVLDEPSFGLSKDDTAKIAEIVNELKQNGNTVLLNDHSYEMLKISDTVTVLGPNAGNNGGKIMYSGDTSDYLQKFEIQSEEKLTKPINENLALSVRGACANNLQNIDSAFFAQELNVITGNSGSGKTSLLQYVIKDSLKYKKPIYCKNFELDKSIESFVFTGQEIITASSLSVPATRLQIFDFIRQTFAKQAMSKELGLKLSDFSFNSKSGQCPDCKGSGVSKTSMDYWSDSVVVCETCNGKRYKDSVLQVKINNLSIADILELSFSEFYSCLDGLEDVVIPPKIKSILDLCEETGISYLSLGQQLNTCLLYTSPSPRDVEESRMPSSA